MRQPLSRFMALLLCLCLLPAAALAYGEHPVFTDPVTRAEMTITFDVHADAFPADGKADYAGWEAFLGKVAVKGVLDVQQPFTENVRAWFDGGLYLKDRLTVPFQFDVYGRERFLSSRALRDESLYFQMDNFLEFMMKPCYYMEMPSNLISLGMYPEASLELWQRYCAPVIDLCKGEGKRTVPYEDLLALCQRWDAAHAADGENAYRLQNYLTNLLYDLGVSYEVYDQLGCMTDFLERMDPDHKGLVITSKKKTETYKLGGTTVFTRKLTEARNFTLTLPDEYGNVLTLTSVEKIGNWRGDDWALTLSITHPAAEEGGEPVNYLTLALDMDKVPLRDHYETTGKIRFTAEGEALAEPVAADFELVLYRTDIDYPNLTRWSLSYLHPETGLSCFTATAELLQQEMPYTVLRENAYPYEDFFHLNDEYIQRIKANYTASLVVSFLPVITEMPAGVLNDVIRFSQESGILLFLGME
ncbi:MAG: hypothetical protein E7320_12645 [Clostridiales bacterium]|nr:hypothetical protein [Clostridiales bacterium]